MKITFVCSSHTSLGNTGQPTGIGLQTFADPYFSFVEAGADVKVASLNGGACPIDPDSLSPELATSGTRRFFEDPHAQQLLVTSHPLCKVLNDHHDCLFFTGGHAGMWDFADTPEVASAILQTLSRNRPVATICHGAAALCGVMGASGQSIIKNHRVTALTNAEEFVLKRDAVVPFLLEGRLKSLGAHFKSKPAFSSHVVQDRLLITGQNMRSANSIARVLLTMLAV